MNVCILDKISCFLGFVFLISVSCRQSIKSKPINHANSIDTEIKDASFSLKKELTLDSAVLYYGCPEKRIQFNLSTAAITEFRIGLLNYYNQDQRFSGRYIIEEVTWKKDDSTLVTVWYEKTDSCTFPVDAIIYDKNVCF